MASEVLGLHVKGLEVSVESLRSMGCVCFQFLLDVVVDCFGDISVL